MSVLSENEIPCILLFLNRKRNSQNSPKRMHPKVIIYYNSYLYCADEDTFLSAQLQLVFYFRSCVEQTLL